MEYRESLSFPRLSGMQWELLCWRCVPDAGAGSAPVPTGRWSPRRLRAGGLRSAEPLFSLLNDQSVRTTQWFAALPKSLPRFQW